MLLAAGEYVDAKRAVHLEHLVGTRIAPDADKQRWRRVRHTADGRRCQSVSARRTVCRNDVHRRAEPAHGIPECLLINAYGHGGFSLAQRSSTSCGVFEREQQSKIWSFAAFSSSVR